MRFLLLFLLMVSPLSFAGPKDETRFCGEPARDADGRISRNRTIYNEFRKLYPCPTTGLETGACPKWSVDHVIPLACGGCDAVSNMQWLPNAIKSGIYPSKDRWERSIYDKYECVFVLQK